MRSAPPGYGSGPPNLRRGSQWLLPPFRIPTTGRSSPYRDWAGWTRAQQHGPHGPCIGTPLTEPSRRSPWLDRQPNATHRLLPLCDRFGCVPTGRPPTSSLHCCRWPAIHSGVPPLPERPGGTPPGCSPSVHLRMLNRPPDARPRAWRAIPCRRRSALEEGSAPIPSVDLRSYGQWIRRWISLWITLWITSRPCGTVIGPGDMVDGLDRRPDRPCS